MKTFKLLREKDGVALTTGLVVGLLGGTYVSQVVNGIVRLVSNRDFSYPVNDIVWPLVTFLFALLLIELLVRGLGLIKQGLAYTLNALKKNSGISLAVGLALTFPLTSQLSTIAGYLARMILRLGDGNGAHPLGVDTNLFYPLVGIAVSFILVELALRVLSLTKKLR